MWGRRVVRVSFRQTAVFGTVGVLDTDDCVGGARQRGRIQDGGEKMVWRKESGSLKYRVGDGTTI